MKAIIIILFLLSFNEKPLRVITSNSIEMYGCREYETFTEFVEYKNCVRIRKRKGDKSLVYWIDKQRFANGKLSGFHYVFRHNQEPVSYHVGINYVDMIGVGFILRYHISEINTEID